VRWERGSGNFTWVQADERFKKTRFSLAWDQHCATACCATPHHACTTIRVTIWSTCTNNHALEMMRASAGVGVACWKMQSGPTWSGVFAKRADPHPANAVSLPGASTYTCLESRDALISACGKGCGNRFMITESALTYSQQWLPIPSHPSPARYRAQVLTGPLQPFIVHKSRQDHCRPVHPCERPAPRAELSERGSSIEHLASPMQTSHVTRHSSATGLRNVHHAHRCGGGNFVFGG
jgi:hypothetical protein